MTDDRHTLEASRKRQLSGPDDNLLNLGLWVCLAFPGAVGVLGLWRQRFGIPFILQQTTWPLNPEPILIGNGWTDINKAKDKSVTPRQCAVLSLLGWNGLRLGEVPAALCGFLSCDDP